MMRPSSRMGAATCITVSSGRSGAVALERAPYSPRSVRSTSFQREWSRPMNPGRVSNTTTPRASVTLTCVSMRSLGKPQSVACGRTSGSARKACANAPVARVPAFSSGAASCASV